MTTILDYIMESESICRDIVNHRASITQGFIRKFQNKSIEEIIIVGSGTSHHAAAVAKPLFEQLLPVMVTTMFPTVFISSVKRLRKNTVVIGLSQSGTSASTIAALEYAKSMGITTVSITAIPSSPIVDVSSLNLMLECGEEKAVAKTKGYLASVVTLWMMAMQLAKAKNFIEFDEEEDLANRCLKTINNFPKVLEDGQKWYNRVDKKFDHCDNLIVVGADEQMGNVFEATLKLVETIRVPVMGHEVEEFMHGIYNAIKPSTFIVYLIGKQRSTKRMVQLYQYLQTKTEFQFAISSTAVSENDCVCRFVDDEIFSPIEYILPVQLLCHYVPEKFGINPFLSGDPLFHPSMKSKS
mgnify:CR=1 FL=1